MTNHRNARARSAVFAPIGGPGRALRVERRLDEAIRSGLLDDGERLPSEPRLAAMLGVSTVTAREALGALRAQGLVTTVRGRGGGTFVNRPRTPDDSALRHRLATTTRAELADRGAAYRLVLAGCAELAAERADDEDAEALRTLLLPRDHPDAAAYRRADAELHLSLAGLTHSASVARQVVGLEADFGTLLRLTFADPALRAVARDRQGEVVDAVAGHRPDAARAAMRAQVRRALEALDELHAELA